MQFFSAALLLLWLGGPAFAAELSLDFGEAPLNEPPPGFRSTLTGEGKPGEWRIILDDAPSALPPLSPRAANMNKRPVLAQLARVRTDEHFPLLIYEEEAFGDFTLTTRFKIVDGAAEQMAGIAFRIQDERNYYYIRASALGSTFSFFKIVNGIRSPPTGVKVEISKGVWHQLVLDCKGNNISALLDGAGVLPPLSDTSFLSGKIGYWTKSDSVSYFTDTQLSYIRKEIFAQTLVRDTLKRFPRLLGLKIFAATNGQAEPQIIASTNLKEVGQPGHAAEQDVIAHSRIYHGRDSDAVMVTMPLHDSNGETVAAVKVVMKAFSGQTEKNAIARAMPIVQQIEGRVQSAKDLTQ